MDFAERRFTRMGMRGKKWKVIIAGAAVLAFSAAWPSANPLASGRMTASGEVQGREAAAEEQAFLEDVTVLGAALAETVLEGYVDGTDSKISWTYDPKTKTVVVTGKGTRTYGRTSSFPAGAEHIRFENFRMEGSWDYMFSGLRNLISIDFDGV